MLIQLPFCSVEQRVPTAFAALFITFAPWFYSSAISVVVVIPFALCSLGYTFSDLLSTSSNSECQDGLVGGHADCPFQRRIIPAHRLRPRRTHPEIFQVTYPHMV